MHICHNNFHSLNQIALNLKSNIQGQNMYYNFSALLIICFGLFSSIESKSQERIDRFQQFSGELPTPNVYRTASGAPGHEYYQNRADYVMKIILDDENQRVYGEESITYTNNSKDELNYLWVQLDQNMMAKDSDTKKIATDNLGNKVDIGKLERMFSDYDGGFKLEYVKDKQGKELPHTINKTMMRIDLPSSLKSGASFSFQIKWWWNINDRAKLGGRGGLEYFEEEDNYIYTLAHFFPRMAVYNDVEGWQHKQFLGRGEFALPFGNYEVSITTPEDHVVAATGVLQNESDVLTADERNRLKEARNSDKPVFIVTADEALAREKEKKTATKTWKFKAENVRDFAFASSRKFIWDAQGVKFGNRTVLAMSYYPKEGNPLWEKYSTKVVAHTLNVYSKHTFDYPYPVAISVHTNRIGMEYPMICFNGGRPESDGTYSEATKYGMISVIIHEVGHNYFPMIVNSDERQWTWMDEGLNTYLQYLTEKEWDVDYPSRRGPAYKIVDYMSGDKNNMVPIMTNSESIMQFGNNAYGKPATALNILRESIVGRELFDFAFKEYSQRWMFKHPSPADFFRTIEDATAVDLDWFWRSWFFTTDHVDLGISQVRHFTLDDKNPENWKESRKKVPYKHIGDIRNEANRPNTVLEKDLETRDFYNDWDRTVVHEKDQKEYEAYLAKFTPEQQELLKMKMNFYEITFEMIGDIPMPIILQFDFEDGTSTQEYIPAEIWKMGDRKVTKVFYFEKELEQVILDPNLETADTDMNNNAWPASIEKSQFEIYKSNQSQRDNPMRKYQAK